MSVFTLHPNVLAVQALLAKGIIDRDSGSFLITDRFFRLWIQSAQSVL